MKNTIGWVAILLAVFSLAPSIVPGAMSLMGLLIALFSLIVSVFSVAQNRKSYFNITLVIVLLGILVANDTLRLWGSLAEAPVQFKLTTYGISFLVIVGCALAANGLNNRVKNT